MTERVENLSVLIVEDNATMREGMVRVVEKLGHGVVAVETAEQGLAACGENEFNILVSDYKLPGKDGLELLIEVRQKWPETEVLMITAFGTIEVAVEAMQKGAADFMTKPFSPEELTIKLDRLADKVFRKSELQRISDENTYLRQELAVQFNFGEIVGNSPAMQSVYRTIQKVSNGDSTVIIYGESGTGKELVARAIHKASGRSKCAFVRVNCGALAEGVLESELFGHERGAFTGAVKRKKGRFELAQRGSIFLDEIGDLPLNTQVKLLRILQEREFERVGGEETLEVDVRIIAATNKNLQDKIAAGTFREDLYYRLHIIPINLPPLRNRREDIPLLTEHFIAKTRSQLGMPKLIIDEAARGMLQNYDWPGNIREFENVIERAAVLCDDSTIKVTDLPFDDSGDTALKLPGPELHLNRSLEVLERQLLERAMQKANGVKTEAARMLGIKTSALYYKLEKYKLI